MNMPGLAFMSMAYAQMSIVNIILKSNFILEYQVLYRSQFMYIHG